MADSAGIALLVVLDRLTPAERLAFVLHDMFAVSFDEIAPMIGRSPAAASNSLVVLDAAYKERWSVPSPISANKEKS
jgi:hypothetical protein